MNQPTTPNQSSTNQPTAQFSSRPTVIMRSIKAKLKLPWWGFAVIGVVLWGLILGGGFFTYSQLSSFADGSFSGRNAESLLDVATPKVTPIATVSSVLIPNVTTKPIVSGENAVAPPVMPIKPPVFLSSSPLVNRIKLGLPTTVMVVGYGGAKHEGAYLSDTIMLMTFDPTKNAITMVNIPRDLYVFVPYGGQDYGYWGKINSAFSFVMDTKSTENFSARYKFNPNQVNSRLDAAVTLLKDVVEKVTATRIDYWATFSFEGFRKFIDAVGGVQVQVETAFDDYEYPANDNPLVDASVMHISFEAGLQYMNGERAIQYARSRKSSQDGNDFGRSKRQMKLIAAIKTRATRPDIILKTFNIMSALQGNMRTSFSLDDIRALVDYVRGEGADLVSKVRFVPQVLSTDNLLVSGSDRDSGYILLPAAGQGKYGAIQEWLNSNREFALLRLENLKIQVRNASGQRYEGGKVTDDLVKQGLTLLEPTLNGDVLYSVIYDYSDGNGFSTLEIVENLLPNVPVKPLTRPLFDQQADIVIVLGRDYLQSARSSDKADGNNQKVIISGVTTPRSVYVSPERYLPTPFPTRR